MKAKVKLGLAQKTVPAKVELARTIVLKMTGNINFQNPLPALGTLTNALDACEAAYSAAQTGGKQQTAELYDAEAVLDDVLTQLSLYVENISNGSDAIILSAGMDTKAAPLPAQQPSTPENLLVENATTANTLILQWNKANFAKMYVVEQNNDATNLPEGGWTMIAMQTQRKLVVDSLTSGSKYAFRVKAVGVAGKSGYCNPAVQRVL